MLLGLMFAGVALFLAALGIYGMLAYQVAQRRREIGIRMALGSDATRIFRMVLGEGLVLLAIGFAAGLVMAVVVILLFLLSVRSTLVTAISIPVSVLITLIGLRVGGYSLNILTLGALTIAVGRVVDDSIVVLENIKRHLEYGEPKRQAILAAVREVAGAVTASTLTTVAVFAPIALPDISQVTPRITRTFKFERGDGGWQINGRFMDCTRFRLTPQLNTAERWIIQNDSGGWQHPMVVNEMIRYYAAGAHGEQWDQPTAEQLLAIAAELGEGSETPRT